MGFGSIVNFIVNNAETVVTIGGVLFAGGGAYAIKVKIAYGKVQKAMKELEDVDKEHKKISADGVYTAEEVKSLMSEVTEAVFAVKDAMNYIWSVIPEKFRKKLPRSF
jgi:hypothetical protein